VKRPTFDAVPFLLQSLGDTFAAKTLFANETDFHTCRWITRKLETPAGWAPFLAAFFTVADEPVQKRFRSVVTVRDRRRLTGC